MVAWFFPTLFYAGVVIGIDLAEISRARCGSAAVADTFISGADEVIYFIPVAELHSYEQGKVFEPEIIRKPSEEFRPGITDDLYVLAEVNLPDPSFRPI